MPKETMVLVVPDDVYIKFGLEKGVFEEWFEAAMVHGDTLTLEQLVVKMNNHAFGESKIRLFEIEIDFFQTPIENPHIDLKWHLSDVLSRAKTDGFILTREQGLEVLNAMESHDDSNIGINWEVISTLITCMDWYDSLEHHEFMVCTSCDWEGERKETLFSMEELRIGKQLVEVHRCPHCKEIANGFN